MTIITPFAVTIGIIIGCAGIYFYFQRKKKTEGVEAKEYFINNATEEKFEEVYHTLKSEGVDLPRKEGGGALEVSTDSNDEVASSSNDLNEGEKHTFAKIKKEMDGEENEPQ